MKPTHTPDIDLILDRAVADGRRRRALAGMQDAANRRLARYCRANTLAVMCSCVAATFLLFLTVLPVPDGRDMHAAANHQVVLEQANMLIAAV